MAKTARETAEPTTAVAVRQFSNEDLLNISSFEDAIALVNEAYGDVLTADEVIGNGFRMLGDKHKLVGVPFVAVQWKFFDGDYGTSYTNMMVVTDRGDRYLVNDGGAGITKELMEFSARSDRMGGVVFRNGLAASTYDFCSDCRSTSCEVPEEHRMTPATTFYLDLSA